MTDDQFKEIMRELHLIAGGVGAILGIIIIYAWFTLK